MSESLAKQLRDTWAKQIESGFILGNPDNDVETRLIPDPIADVTFRLRWLPHRNLRTDTEALERRRILDPDRDETLLFRDPRDPSGRHCFLCPANVRVCHPAEVLVPVHAGGRDWFAGANFAWLANNHFTVISDQHIDQRFDRTVVNAMLDLHAQTAGEFRVVFNGAHAGATIPWHLHLQITTDPFPVEQLAARHLADYPVPMEVIPGTNTVGADVAGYVESWQARDPQHHRVNLLVAPRRRNPAVFIFLRDTRFTIARSKGLMGGWEVAGEFAYSDRRADFQAADLNSVRAAYSEIRPPAWG